MKKFLEAIKFFLTQYPDNEDAILIKDRNLSLF